MLHATAILYVSFMQHLEHDPSMKKYDIKAFHIHILKFCQL